MASGFRVPRSTWGGLLRSCLGQGPQAFARHKQSTGLFVSGLTPPEKALGQLHLLYFTPHATPRPRPQGLWRHGR